MMGQAGADCTSSRVEVGQGLLFVLSGPSGVGKDAVIAELKAQGLPVHFTVGLTTRPPRQGERDGVDYHFASPEVFDALRSAGELLEWAVVHGDEYGTPREQVRAALASGRHVLLKIDVQGAANVRRQVPQAVLIFLAPPSLEDLRARLSARRTESPEALAVRLRDAEREMAQLPHYDYVVVNRTDRLATAVEQTKAIIIAESCRISSRRVVV